MTDDRSRPERLDCRRAMERLFDLLDGELTPERARAVRSHITGCPDCFTHADFERRFLEAIGAGGTQRNCSEALRQKVLAALRAEGWSSESPAT